MRVTTHTTTCSGCDCMIAPGASHYVLSLHIVSGFDGVLQDTSVEPSHEIPNILEENRHVSADDLEESVALSRSYTICPPCRARILKDPLQRGKEGPAGFLV